MKIEIYQQEMELLPQKGVWWPQRRTLLVSDLHLGKITHFRKEGIAVPASARLRNFIMLDQLVQTYLPERMIILGDLFHNIYNAEWEQFIHWREQYVHLHIEAIAGNHDILPRELYDQSAICYRRELYEGNFHFTHDPATQQNEDFFTFCGHIHPVFCLRSPSRQSLRLPCYVITARQMILPSFGVFTGGYEMDKSRGREIYVIAEDKVFKV